MDDGTGGGGRGEFAFVELAEPFARAYGIHAGSYPILRAPGDATPTAEDVSALILARSIREFLSDHPEEEAQYLKTLFAVSLHAARHCAEEGDLDGCLDHMMQAHLASPDRADVALAVSQQLEESGYTEEAQGVCLRTLGTEEAWRQDGCGPLAIQATRLMSRQGKQSEALDFIEKAMDHAGEDLGKEGARLLAELRSREGLF
jgi:hypothetical protein